MEKSYGKRWEIVEELGEGGQGKVWLVRDKQMYTDAPFLENFRKSLSELGSGATYGDAIKKEFEKFQQGILDIVKSNSPSHQGALKVLHAPEDSRDPDRADERIQREIRAMSEANHPNLLPILDSNIEEGWFVSKYQDNGTLHKNLHLFMGNFPAALTAFRPLVAAVAELHAKNIVHRDIKPANVFLSSENDLVLGDFGLVYFTDEEHTRISGTLENVGTRDWMPTWAFSQRIEDVQPTFDVFTLGKLLWAMVAAKPLLLLWYFNRPDANVEHLFANSPYIEFANQLFSQCIVENEEDCLPDAGALLKEVDRILRLIDLRADVISEKHLRVCRVCGIGQYEIFVDRNRHGMGNFGIRAVGNHTLKIFKCSHCGNVQLFSFDGGGKLPPAWDNS